MAITRTEMTDQTICPFLGLRDDPISSFPYPSKENLCHHSRPLQSARGTYQYQYCLTSEHTTCPLYQVAAPVAMPDAIASPFLPAASARRVVALAGVPLLLALIAVFGFALKAYGSRLFVTGSIPGTGQQSPRNDAGTSPALSTTRDATALFSSRNTAQPTRPNCPIPGGWTSYTVNPTDTIYRLSAVYGVAVQRLQAANCLGNNTVLLPGQVIYVPSTATSVAPIDLAIIPTLDVTSNQINQTPTESLPTFTAPFYGPPTPVPQPQPPVPTSTNPPPVVIPNPPAQPTNTPASLPTNTLQPSQTPVTPSNTPVPSNTVVLPTFPPTPTRTLHPSNTPKPSNTPHPSDTPIPTNTAIIPPIDTNTPPPTATDAPSPQPTNTPVPPATDTTTPPIATTPPPQIIPDTPTIVLTIPPL